MQIVTTSSQLQQALQKVRAHHNTIGLVPTMGNLHAGHMALVGAAVSDCDFALATIFVNPLQFGASEDLSAYPRTPDEDIHLLQEAGCELLFTPSIAEIYPDGLERHTRVHVPALTDEFCGASRPGHFDGVTTVVAKLFNLTQPDRAYFGLKDFQQFLVIRKMVKDLAMDIQLTGIETVREPSGLAMSSRNNYLTAAQRLQAASIYQTLLATAASIQAGDTDYPELERNAAMQLAGDNSMLDYFAIRDADNLQTPCPETAELVILTAVRIGPTRLIDNIRIASPR